MKLSRGITSRQNALVKHLRRLGADAAYRKECGEFLCAGSKLLNEAESAELEITQVLTQGECNFLDYISGLKSPPDLVFSAKIPTHASGSGNHIIALDAIQDPGNLGTIIRGAGAFGFGVVLLNECADPWQMKVLRASAGAVFRVPLLTALPPLPLYAAVAHGGEDIRTAKLPVQFAIAIGNEGHGLSEDIRARCVGKISIPIHGESLNAAVAANIVMFCSR